MTSVENPLLALPYAVRHSVQWCAHRSWSQQVHPGHTPDGGMCFLQKTMGLKLLPPEDVQQLLAQMVREMEQRIVSSQYGDMCGDQYRRTQV